MVYFHQHIRVYFGILLALSLRALCESSVSIASAVLIASAVSIQSAEPYINQRFCVQQCLYHPDFDDDLAPFLGCNPPLNGCYCRADLAASVSYFLTSCVNVGCSSHSADISQAISVYDGYCSSNAPATNAATSTVDGAAPTATVRVVTTVSSSSNAVSGATSQALSEYLQDWVLLQTTLCLFFLGHHWR